jgi:hypothetical protein
VTAAHESTRRLALERAAIDTATAWAHQRMDALRAEGREVAGGWPGTLSEARHFLRATLTQSGLASITHQELEHTARAVYARARSMWLSRAQREEGEDEGEWKEPHERPSA